MNLRLMLAHAGLMLRVLARNPAYSVPTILFPAMFYTIFALQYAKTSAIIADQVMASYVAFAVIGVAMFQFGVGIANERGRPFERYIRSLHVSAETRFAARIVVAVIFAFISASIVALIATLFTPVSLSALQWLELALYTIICAVPFVMMGVAIAYLVPSTAAMPITNVVYLLCAFAGGLWIPPQELPRFAQGISPFLPTRAFAEVLWSVAAGTHPLQWIIALGCFAAAFAALAVFGYRRDERSRYA